MQRKILIAAAALVLAGPALGQVGVDTGVSVKLDLKAMDTDANGMVSKAEAASNEKLAKSFDKYDANKDGNLDKGEFAKFEGEGKASAKGGKSSTPPPKGETAPKSETPPPGETKDAPPPAQ